MSVTGRKKILPSGVSSFSQHLPFSFGEVTLHHIMSISAHSEEMKHTGDCGSELVTKVKGEHQELLCKTENHTENVCNLNIISLVDLKQEKDNLDTALELNSTVPDSQNSVILTAEEHSIHPETRPCKCSQCTKCFLRSDDCETHQQPHKWEKQSFQQILPSKKYCCPHCLKNFATLSHFIVHQQIHRGEGGAERPFGCSQCGKRFYRESGLKAHEQSHAREMLHRCTRCDKLFAKKSILRRHQQTHTTDGPYWCPTCPQTFSSKHSFEKHMGQSHTGQRRSFSHYRRSFSTEHSLKKHKHIVSGKKPHTMVKTIKRKSYWCSHCGKILASLSHFFVHQQIHRGNGKGGRPFSCTQCGKSFYKEKGLKTHEQRHMGEGVHCSTSCGESLTSKSLLIKNQQIPARRKPPRCPKCDRSNSVELRTTKCHYCGKTFSADCTLQQHLETHRETTLDRSSVQNHRSTEDACSMSTESVKTINQSLGMSPKTERHNFDIKNYVEFSPYLHSSECHYTEKQNDTEEDILKEDNGPPDEKPCKILQKFTGPLANRKVIPTIQNIETLAEISGKATKLEKTSVSRELQMKLEDCEFFNEDSCHLKVIIIEEVKEERDDQRDINESLGMKDCAPDVKEGSSVGTQTTELLKRYQQIPTRRSLPQLSDCRKNFLRQDECGVQQQTLITGGHCPKEAADERKMYRCLECGRRFNSTTHYIVHLQIHRKDGKEERPFSCSCCGKSFYRIQGLKKHQQSDVCRGSSCCSQCGKPLNRMSLLNNDDHFITGERVQQCSKCDQGRGASFPKGHRVKSHKQIEPRGKSDNAAGQKLYSCSHCGKIFSKLIDHIVHQQIHREEVGGRSFSCSICGKSFYREGGLRKHQQAYGGQSHSKTSVICTEASPPMKLQQGMDGPETPVKGK